MLVKKIWQSKCSLPGKNHTKFDDNGYENYRILISTVTTWYTV